MAQLTSNQTLTGAAYIKIADSGQKIRFAVGVSEFNSSSLIVPSHACAFLARIALWLHVGL